MTLPKPKGQPQGKYRPQLTANQITHAVLLAKLDLACITSTTHELSLDLLATLSPFKAKIDNMAITPSYTPAPAKPSMASGLGMASSSPTAKPVNSTANTAHTTEGMTKEQQWEHSYNTLSSNPANCTAEQVLQAKEHMYLNDLMSPEEEEAYEAQLALESTDSLANLGGDL